MSYEERLKELGLLSLEEKARGDPRTVKGDSPS